jgi:hypothetical protein
MRQSIARLCPVFNMARVVREYTERYYVPAERSGRLLADGGARAVALSNWKPRSRRRGRGFASKRAQGAARRTGRRAGVPGIGGRLPGRAHARRRGGAALPRPGVDAHGAVTWSEIVPMEPARGVTDGVHLFEVRDAACTGADCTATPSGCCPRHPDLGISLIPGLVTWADPRAAPRVRPRRRPAHVAEPRRRRVRPIRRRLRRSPPGRSAPTRTETPPDWTGRDRLA